MSGLKVVDDKTFTIETSEPVSNLPVRLGYSAFAPLPDSFFKDPKAFEKQPIGAGPFKVDSISNTEFVLSKFADFSGANKANVDKLTFRVYQDPAAAYADAVAGSLDYIDESNIPQDQFIGDAYQSDFPDRWSQREAGRISIIWFSSSDPQLKDKPELRKAISRAIDRDLITKQIWSNTVTPATGWVSPVVDGYKADQCGDSCTFDAAAAKAAFEAAGGYKGTLTMTYNADSPNKAWSEAVCNSIKNTLGIECIAVPTVDFATFNKKVDANELKGIFRSQLADGLPVDRELPGAASTPRVPGLRVELGPVRQPEVRRAERQGGGGDEPRRGQRPVPAGRGAAGRGLPVGSAVVPEDDRRLVRPGHRRQGQRLRRPRLRRNQGEVNDERVNHR